MKTKKIKIVAVDDTPSNLIALQAVFSGTVYEILEASSGQAALDILEKNSDVAIVLLDVQMPGMDGYETAIRIKRMEHHHDIPIIFITAVYFEDPSVRKGYAVGGIDYFSKPFDPEILKTKVGIYAANKQNSILLKEREKRIAETEEIIRAGRKLSSMIESLPIGVLIADSEGKTCQINEEVSRILGTTIAISNNQYGEVLNWWEENQKVMKAPNGPLDKALRLGISTHSEKIEITCMDGTVKAINVSASPLRSLDGHIVGAGLVIQDLTESKKIEEVLEGKIMNLLTLGVELEEVTNPPG